MIAIEAMLYLKSTLSIAQRKKFPIKDFFSKCDQIRSFQILSGKLHFFVQWIQQAPPT